MPAISPEFREFLKKYRIEFIIAAVFLIVAMEMSFAFSHQAMIDFIKNDTVRNAYNWILFILTAIMFLLALISYPKIYKFKILLSVYAMAAFFIIYLGISVVRPEALNVMGFTMDFWRDGNRFSMKFLSTLLAINLLIVVLSRSTINYNKGKNIAITAFFVNVLLCFVALILIEGNYYIAWREKTGFLKFTGAFVYLFNKYALAGNFIIFIVMAVLSVFNIEEEHNYGSIIMAIAVMNFYILLTIMSQPNGDGYYKYKYMLPLMDMLIIVGIFVHWMSCLNHKAHYDPLLKIYNRQHMDAIISGLADIKLGNNFSVFMCDIDHFKNVNDTYGHAAGDDVLFKVAQVIRDTSLPEGVVCRYGGEEIIVFVKDRIDEEAFMKAEKIRKAVKKEAIKSKSKSIKVTMSIGVASTKKGLDDIGKMIKTADDNVYKAKKRGRDRVVAE